MGSVMLSTVEGQTGEELEWVSWGQFCEAVRVVEVGEWAIPQHVGTLEMVTVVI